MTENIDEEHLTNSTGPQTEDQAENTPSEIIHSKDSESVSQNQDIENMEVHHSHHPSHKKKWTEYLLEFFMLFLAVFLGFVAENIRESSVERHREREYINSLISDLKTDTTKLGRNISSFKQHMPMQDSVKGLISQLYKGFNQAFYRNRVSLTGFSDFIYTDATIEQLKNSGGFRLIQDHKIIDSIMAYDSHVKRLLIGQTGLTRVYEKLRDSQNDIFNDQEFDEQIGMGKSVGQLEKEKMNYLLTNDKAVLGKFYNEVRFSIWAADWMVESMERTKLAATRLIHFLELQYNIEKE